MQWPVRLFDKTGVIGALVAAIGCASCFPALGLGFLANYEGIFINTLLPIFAAIALVANALSFFSHKIWYRTLAGIAGPVVVLLTLYPLWAYGWSTCLFYAGLLVMMSVATGDILFPPKKRCYSHR